MCPISIADLAGLAALQLAVLLLFVRIELAVLPLLAYAALCGAASLMPRFGFFLPILSRGRSGRSAVAITFDDGPDPATTPRLLELLARRGVPATFFVPGRRAEQHPELIRRILEGGHALGNHSFHHDPLLMLRRRSTLEQEIARTQRVLKGFGVTPLAFRPPVGATNPRLWRALLRHGLTCVNFSRRAGDFGNRRIAGLADRLLRRIRPDDILMIHDVRPEAGMDVEAWLGEIDRLLAGLAERRLEVVSLSTLLGRPIMESRALSGVLHPAAAFYDALAPAYDAEQARAALSRLKRTERALVESRLYGLLSPSDRVLEIGAGTGIFSLALAGRCRELVAVDVSAGMLEALQRKAKAAQVTNLRCLAGDIETLELPGPFDVVCSFSALEYIPDLAALLGRLARALAPGGRIFFTTSHRSPLRFFAQLGNAMRQGLWLHARSRREILKMLEVAGLRPVCVSTHHLKLPLLGGIQLAVQAEKPRLSGSI